MRIDFATQVINCLYKSLHFDLDHMSKDPRLTSNTLNVYEGFLTCSEVGSNYQLFHCRISRFCKMSLHCKSPVEYACYVGTRNRVTTIIIDSNRNLAKFLALASSNRSTKNGFDMHITGGATCKRRCRLLR